MDEKLITKFMKGAVDAVVSQPKAIKQVGKDLSDIGKTSFKNVKNGIYPDGKFSKTGLAKTMLTMNDNQGRRAANLYTGKKLNTPMILGAAALGATAVVGNPGNLVNGKNLESQKMSDYESLMGIAGLTATRLGPNPIENGQLSAMSADGTAGRTSSQAPTLNASGNMVFGMHNSRH